jgi:hypothetical protein
MSKKTEDRYPIERIPEGCSHLHGNFFMIPFEIIRTPDEDEKPSGSSYSFRNPRTLVECGQADLLDKKLSSELRESIKNRTLLNPLVCRWIKEGNSYHPMVIGGERRYRALDYLIRKKEMVVDPDPTTITVNAEGEWVTQKVTADIAYAMVLCQVFPCNTDLDALALSWAENKSRVNLTDGHEVAEVVKLREARATDDRIMEILQQDSRWLAETDRLIASLDASTLTDLMEGRIDRSSAIELSAIDDLEVRDQVREAANEAAQQTHQRRIIRLQNRIESVQERQEIAEANQVLAPTPEQQQEAIQEIAETRAEINTIKRRKERLHPVASSRDVRRAAEEITGETPQPQGKRGPKGGIRKIRESQYLEGKDYLTRLIRNNGRCPDNTFTAQMDALKLLIRVFNDNILANNPNWAETIRLHYGR